MLTYLLGIGDEKGSAGQGSNVDQACWCMKNLKMKMCFLFVDQSAEHGEWLNTVRG